MRWKKGIGKNKEELGSRERKERERRQTDRQDSEEAKKCDELQPLSQGFSPICKWITAISFFSLSFSLTVETPVFWLLLPDCNSSSFLRINLAPTDGLDPGYAWERLFSMAKTCIATSSISFCIVLEGSSNKTSLPSALCTAKFMESISWDSSGEIIFCPD